MKMMKYMLTAAACVLALQSCLIENDMSYPRVYANVTAFAVEGQESCTINTDSQTVSIVLEETAYINSLKVTQSDISDEATCPDFPKVDDVLDLTEPKKYTLRTYQDYEWTISATQPIERYITCENQGSSPIINNDSKTALVYVVESQSLQSVTITGMKLEREGSEIYLVTDGVAASDPCEFPMEGVDALTALEFEVRYDDVSVRWKVTFQQEIVPIEITSAIPWTYHVDIAATYSRTGTPYIQYRQADSDEWIRFDEVTVNGINISASIPGGDTSDEASTRLLPGTSYEFKVCTETTESDVVTVKTGTPDQIDNMGFDQWHSDNGTWYPNLNSTIEIWDTANGGAALLKKNPTTPEYDFLATDEDGNTAAARLESMLVGMFAAGNIYTGKFLNASFSGGIGAELNWGTPFTARPKALKGYYSYSPKTIDNARSPYESLEGTMDQCQLLVILTDMDEQFTVNTAEGIFFDQTENNANIIAYGKIESDEDTGGEYKEFTIDLDYWRPDATPTYAIVIACASYKGDYFTGGVGSVMYVDEFEFVYD